MFKSISYQENTLEIFLYLTTICQNYCWYCCESHTKETKKEIMRFETFISVFTELKKNKHQINWHVIGGEPTLHPRFYDIVNCLLQANNTKTVEIFSNGIRIIKRERFINTEKLKFCFSAHYQQRKNIFQNIDKLGDIAYYINYIIFSEEQANDPFLAEAKAHNIYDKISFMPMQIMKTGEYKLTEFYLKHEQKIFFVDGHLYSLSEVLRKKLNSFRGRRCYKACIRIDCNGAITLLGKREYISITNLASFDLPYDICVHDQCNDEDSLVYNIKK